MDYPQSSSRAYGFFNDIPGVRVLIALNLAVFVVAQFVPAAALYARLGLVPAAVVNHGQWWQVVTYLFTHAGLGHLVLNMLMLWMFGAVIERRWGTREFVAYFFITGIGAGICSILMNTQSLVPVVGASGAIFGILVAFAMMFPESVILMFFFVPMKMKHAVVVLAGINLLGALSNPGSGVAYIAHLGGGLVGFLYLKGEAIRIRLRSWRPISPLQKIQQQHQRRQEQRQLVLDEEVDRILDKISREGMTRITPQERETLKAKSRQL